MSMNSRRPGKRYRAFLAGTIVRNSSKRLQLNKCVKMSTQRFLLASSTVLFITCCLLTRSCAVAEEVNSLTSRISRGPDDAQMPSLARGEFSMANNADTSEERLVNMAPRQYFKLHIVPGRNSKRNIHKQVMRRAFNHSNADGNGNNSNSYVGKQKISNATLKKLLNQSLLKGSLMNGTSSLSNSTSIKGSNFKFVFIQRAAIGSSNNGSLLADSTQTSNRKLLNNHQKQTSSSLGQASQPSLAASVSKHLASSLLSSAVSMMGNLSNSAPSLSSLASQIVTHSLDSVASNSRSSNTTSGHTDSSAASGDSSESNKQKTADKGKDRNLLFAGAINTKTKQPSKVYNLPVKFVTDGQPYHAVVLSTIKKHFATIKKLQQANSNNNNEPHVTAGNTGSDSSGQVKRKKAQHSSHQRLKGNSRLIYLPLKYLSNARPSKVISSKTLHKSTS